MTNPEGSPEREGGDYKSFFGAMSAEQYFAKGFTRNTRAEVDFLFNVCALTPGQSVLDVG